MRWLLVLDTNVVRYMIDIDIALLRIALLEDHRLVLRRAYQLGFCTKHETSRVVDHDPYDQARCQANLEELCEFRDIERSGCFNTR